MTEEQEQVLAAIQVALTTKTDNVVEWVKSQRDLITLVNLKVKELSEFKKRIETRLDNFDSYTNACLVALDTPKLEGKLYAIKRRKPTKVVVIHDETKIPMDFIKLPEPPAPTVMKAEIAKALKAGTEVPGAALEDSKTISITYDTK